MIIFNLDGTLADNEHRKRFVQRTHCYHCGNNEAYGNMVGCYCMKEKFIPDWKSYYEACDQDSLIWPVKSTLVLNSHRDINIWSGRCESVRKKTIKWLVIYTDLNENFIDSILKMRPIGDHTPEHELKERWLEETYSETKWGTKTNIEFVFEIDPESIKMFRSRGIFVFNCNQGR